MSTTAEDIKAMYAEADLLEIQQVYDSITTDEGDFIGIPQAGEDVDDDNVTIRYYEYDQGL